MAHFHYTIMGGLVFAFFAGIYYWLPKMTGVELNETLGKIHFWRRSSSSTRRSCRCSPSACWACRAASPPTRRTCSS